MLIQYPLNLTRNQIKWRNIYSQQPIMLSQTQIKKTKIPFPNTWELNSGSDNRFKADQAMLSIPC